MIRGWQALGLLLGILAASCGDGGPLTFALSEAFTPDEREQARLAIEDWRPHSLTTLALVEPGEAASWSIELTVDVSGSCDGTSRTIRVARGGVEWMRYAFGHEVGHAMGLGDLEGVHATMAPYKGDVGLTEADLTECRRVGSCR